MKITSVAFVLCQYPLPRPIPLSCGQITARSFGLVRVETDGGEVGWGETSVNFPPWCVHERRATIEEGLAPLLVGENPLDVGRLWRSMMTAVRPFTRMWGEGALVQAISGVDQALWDIAGQFHGVPVHQLLGGAHHREVPCYATGIRADDPAAGGRDAVAQGYRIVKTRVGFDDATDLAKTRALREAVGDGIGIMIDANQAFDGRRATKMIAALADLDPYWIEEPVLNDDAEGYRRLKDRFPDIRFAWGENAFDVEQVRAACAGGAIDVVMPDPCRSGGLTACREIGLIADRYALPVSPHHYGSDLGFAAALHVIATQPRIEPMLRDIAPVPLRDEIVTTPLVPTDGRVAIPDRPGLGVAPDMAVVERTRVRL